MPLTAEDLASDRRLIILRALRGQAGYTLNSSMLQEVLAAYGHVVSRPIVHADLAWLHDQALLVSVTPVGSVHVAQASQKGADVAARTVIVDGVRRPRPRPGPGT